MENTPVKAEIKKIVKEIRKREIVDHFDIPEEFRNNAAVITRKAMVTAAETMTLRPRWPLEKELQSME